MRTIIHVDGVMSRSEIVNADFIVQIFSPNFVYVKHRYDRHMVNCAFPLKDLPAHIVNNETYKHIEETKFTAKWGTYGKSGKEPLVYKRLIDLESDHLQSIARTQAISSEYRNIIIEILQDRGVLPR